MPLIPGNLGQRLGQTRRRLDALIRHPVGEGPEFVPPVGLHGLGQVVFQTGSGGRVVLQVDQEGVCVVELPQRTQSTVGDRVLAGQIGRASCRERV